MAGQLDLEHFLLAGGELRIGRHCARHIARVAHLRLCARIEQEELPATDPVAVVVIVERLAVHCGNGREREHEVVRSRHFLHSRRHFALPHSRTYHL